MKNLRFLGHFAHHFQRDPGEKFSLAGLLTIFLLFVAGLAAASIFTYLNYEQNLREEVDEQLAAVAALKVTQLENWRAERLADARLFYQNPNFSTLAAAFLQSPSDAAARAALTLWLEKLQADPQYARVSLLDSAGRERLSIPAQNGAPDEHMVQETRLALASGELKFLDFHRDTPGGPIHLSLLIPLFGAENQPLGALVILVTPDVSLYPSIQNWPIPSQTSESLLIRREGETALFLNPLRFAPEAALNRSLPLAQAQTPATQAALGQEGIMDGVDYRGVPVIAYVSAVSDSPWFLVAKIDSAEVYAPLRERLWQTALFFAALCLAAGAGLWMLWRQQQLRFYRAQAQLSDALRESNLYLENLFNYANAPIIVWDAQLRITRFNHAFEILTGRTAAEVLGRSLEILFPPEKTQASMRLIENTLSGARWEAVEIEIQRADGSARTVLWNSATLFSADGRAPIAAIAQGQDISERKRAEEILKSYSATLENEVQARTSELREAQEKLLRHERLATLGQLAGSIGHELRNPLGVISNAVYFLQMAQPQASDKVKQYLDMMARETRAADKIISDLLDFTRIKSLDRQEFSLADLAEQSLQRLPAPAGVQTRLNFPADLPPAYADPQHVGQILSNLVSNAFQAMPQGGELVISADFLPEQQQIRLKVADNGQGIAPENMEKLFEPLFTTKIKGIGLGLAVSQKLAEANGGGISVESSLGRGSVFSLFLPVYQEEQA
ncbi:MAG: hypothetical protein Fur0035_04820 [Anaerolineales bacterium]